MLKRLFDIVFSLLGLVLLSPLLIIVSFVIVLKDGFPIIYKQERVGLSGKHFSIFKFRTMVKNAANIGPFYTSKNDPRITKIGAFLRRTSLDEIPQLLNVLKGDMSLVGPRPNVEKQREEYQSDDWDLRNSVLPGITGLAQVSGRSSCSFEQRLDFDVSYVQTHNIFLDMKIIILTVSSVLLKKGSF